MLYLTRLTVGQCHAKLYCCGESFKVPLNWRWFVIYFAKPDFVDCYMSYIDYFLELIENFDFQSYLLFVCLLHFYVLAFVVVVVLNDH